MKKLIFLVFSLLGLFCVCRGQIDQDGQCDLNVSLQEGFQIEEFLGTWHELHRTANPYQQGDCSSFRLERPPNTDTASIIPVVYESVHDNFAAEAIGAVTVPADGSARLDIAISSFPSPLQFWVRVTDYESVALTFSCENLSNTRRRVHIWVLGREPHLPSGMSSNLINTALNNLFDISLEQLEAVNHSPSSCVKLPTIEPNQPILLPGTCDATIPVVQQFQVDEFEGVWHQISNYHTDHNPGSCNRAEYTNVNGVVNVLNSEVRDQVLHSITGHATVSSSDNSAKLLVTLNLQSGGIATQDLWIVGTDYKNYAVAYTCVQESPTYKRVFSWVLSRRRRLSEESEVAINKVIDSIVELNRIYYQPTDQSDAACFFYPDPVPNTPVVFRGQCESVDVQAMSGFDITEFMGTWHTIEMYPASSQSGTCSNAVYDLTDDSKVTVVNSHVVAQELLSVNAVGTLASDDGTAKLEVTFPNIPDPFLYWVLKTDYENYALVYSCTNINEDEMRVVSWKLSRTKELLATSSAEIDAVIDTVAVLRNDYYEDMLQTPEACFYFPNPEPGVPVVFPGSCDETVPVLPTLDFNQFNGKWYEVQSYPNSAQPGHCISHDFIISGTTGYNVESYSIYDQFVTPLNGVLTISPNNDGKMTLTIPNANGPAKTIPFWVLGTDYNDYALAYSCENDNGNRKIWSWKLSRSTTLSASANTYISSLTSSVVVLDDQYYRSIDHSESACAYLPDLEPGDDIILPGQCDTTITGIENFDTYRYAGRWRLIESYANRRQTGTCIVAEYTYVDSSTLNVVNSQVDANQGLGTMALIARSENGDGKLTVTRAAGGGPTFELIILDTDYTSYALAYGCTQLEDNQKRIYSWKLSRQNTLSETAITNINKVISGIEVLNNRFYYEVDRSQAGCFYYPPVDSSSLVRFRGQCSQYNNIPVVTNFDVENYMGIWHNIESYPVTHQNGKCNNANYTLTGTGVEVLNSEVIDEGLVTISGTAVLEPSTDNSAKLQVTFTIGGNQVTTDLWVLTTNYFDYSLAYSCRDDDDEFMYVSLWKLSRRKQLDEQHELAIANFMNSIPILDQRYFITRDHSPEACFYFPVYEPGKPVVFPGTCDDSIVAQPQFNMQQFQGLWHEIEAYPESTRNGQCVTRQFTVSGNNFYVQSSNVFNAALSTTSTTLFAPSDNSGKFTFTVPSSTGSGTIEIPYWILSTDYQNYALAYSCIQQDEDYRQVWSWKLSKSKTVLTPDAQTAINSAISSVVVLDNQYYEKVDQSDQACFYLPDLSPGEPVILPGTCDRTIAGIPNFDLNRYSGRWRLIESYGSNFQTGTCNVAEYTEQGSGVLGVVNSQVSGQNLQTATGTARLSSDDGSGKLLIQVSDSAEPIEFIVLDTDYANYAFAYSCVDLENDQRRVYSWKLSRQNTLSETAITNINRIIDTIDVLHNPYYYNIDRSQVGCFYYPPVDSSSLVRFRGQCSQYNNIPVVTNFDVENYMGLWHNIESYPVTHQNGKCNNANYTLTGTGVEVLNSEVIDEGLVTISGTAVLEPSTDNSAKLQVTFTIGGNQVTTDLWVLTTNYFDYSLAYSCQNDDDEFMYVSLWKLSRRKQLDEQHELAIANFMNSIPILDQRYFITRDHSPEACFYFPVYEPGKPVVFPGQCDDSIVAQPQFNMQQFQGLWHEIEAYPESTRNGQCVTRQFTVSGNNFYVQSSNVFNAALSTTSTTLFAPSDNSGKFTFTVPSSTGSGTIEIPYWILSTDYQNYALAYSCIQQDEDYRQVWSWKLSKSKTELTPDTQTAINSAISSVVVLDNQYYEKVDQSDQACFYLPDLSPGEPVILPGTCDRTIAGIPNFDLNRYSGRWRLIESYGSNFQTGTCNVAEYTEQGSGVLGVVNSQVSGQNLQTATGTARLSSDDGSGKLLIQVSDSAEPIEFIVLDTDYANYAFAYSCVDLENDQRRVYSWKLSRQNTLSETAITNIDRIIDTIDVLHNPYYYNIDRSQVGCFYYPPVDSSSLVRFRGQCSQYNNIPVVTNFDVEDYMGLWHNIESYPVTHQNGKCNNAHYTLTGTGVEVLNSEVIDEGLVTISGTAVLEPSTDNSAKLQVTFTIGGNQVTTDLWVLTTNYFDYSLAYSCQNDDDEFMYVSLWKLSRRKQLDEQHELAIANFMNSIPILDQRYFITRDHSPEACFYFPVYEPGKPVVFPGQCDDSIVAQPQFNMQQFQGLWHEIEAYPESTRNGQCVTRQFTVSGNNFYVQSSNVFNAALSTTSTTLFAPSDNSGKFTFTVPSSTGSGTIEIPYWILSTDYQNYALAYSCIQQDEDYRQVWSWKLSKSKTVLTPDAQTAINSAISSVVVLDNQYYEKVDQSDQACFYLPDLSPGEPVILPGTCDRTIAGIPNFDLNRYSGRWRLIESYGSNFQTGTCNVAEYTEQGSGVLGVVNSQVSGQNLQTATGTARLSSDDGSGKLLIQVSDSAEPIEFIVLDTDYANYAFAYSCVDLENDQRRVYSWKLSRQNTLSETAITNIDRIIDTIDVLHNPYYYNIDRSQVGCFYYPPVDSSSLVRFRGQCSQYNNIPVVTNFDVEDYMGIWHNIESYPVTHQNGKCNNAHYTLTGTGVEVLNSEVIDEGLVTISGTAVLEPSTDNSAKLQVTFTIGGNQVTTDLWVLTTNYFDYSLAYSCQNDDDEFMYVSLWKLSRRKQLDEQHELAIANFMNSIPILDQRYFITRDHSPEACFYFPVYEPGKPVVFPGTCDDSIVAQPQFNMQQFQGLWHEIEAYPESTRNGQCVTRQFTVSGNNFYVQSSNVFNAALSTTSTTLFAPSDNSGKFTFTVPSSTGSGTIEIPYWILSTDYQNYALAYSCIQQDEDYRQVWSWKLSKSKTGLTPDAQTAINSAISSVVVLDNQYYEKVDQSDQACFYLPDLSPGEPVILPGKCDLTIAGIPNFDIDRYSGRWRLIESYGSNFQTGTCNVARYKVSDTASDTLDVENSQVVGDALSSISGTARLASNDGTGKLLFTLSSQSMEVIVLDTDYTDYALGYSCVDLENDQRRVYSWKLSRHDTLSPEAITKIDEVINRIDVLHQPYYYTVGRSEDDCFFYPPVDPRFPVVFRGQCREDIPVVQNFDVAGYLKLWHDIESYPMPFQDGSCPNAYYDLYDAETVSVFNTQVINETLDTIVGKAVVTSDDNSAKLEVTFDGFVQGSTKYWVLSTDYTSYAFVYSCTNVDDEFMSVVSWKLSRERYLPTSGITAMEEIIQRYTFLDDRYYIKRDQSREGCFYYPEPQPGVPVVFPGVCDENIQAVPAFDFNRFQGTWHEIQTYPKEQQTGQCISHEFTPDSTTSFLLNSFNVLDQKLLKTEGSVTYYTENDNSGKLKIVIQSGGQTITIPYWILDTDYTSYALVYSCVQNSDDYRGVFSWKLSRSKQLTPDNNVLINEAMNQIDVLNNNYFETIQQTDNACFYYPELGVNDPVIFPGRCDANIPVFQGFEPARYLGHWRLIESYYTSFQTGTCNTATYSAGPDNSVIVYNTRVEGQELFTITGSATVATSDGSAKLLVTFPGTGEPTDYWILDTDYTEYALVYTCQDLADNQRRVWSWKLSRENVLSPSATEKIDKIVESIDVLHSQYYQRIGRSEAECFYFPTPNPETNVVFPGQCDENIQVVQQFNVNEYQGTWFDLESYPTGFQSGTCNTAYYDLNADNTLEVLNTQIVNQLLQSRPGNATPTTNDGSAKFEVNFEINGELVSRNYWVLATDYENFSFVYSCRNIDAESREVFSWKLSRTKTLAPQHTQQINNVIQAVQVLDPQYYVTRQHSPEDCFYYPDNNGGDVILYGSCTDDISYMQDFDPALFQGTWHEVSRFPSDLQEGDCTASSYTLDENTNTFSVIQTSVNEEEQVSTVMQASVATDGRGVITITNNGVPFNEVYILDTDYEEYAVLYSCRDLDLEDERKQVYSWKLSRNRTSLSESAINAINQLVVDNVDLNAPYYRETGQDINACFHYPDLDNPTEIVLPELCNPEIQGIPDFDAYEYLGRWFEIARYPQTTQTGQCNRAVYSDLQNATVKVVNSQVIDERLSSIEGTATAYADGSGSLNVNFVVNEETRSSNYLILATDYSSYAVVYSCASNYETNERKVGSWILSRNSTLSETAQTEVDAVIAATQGLDPRYYQKTSQELEDCFYVPDLEPLRAPRFRGQCEDVQGIQVDPAQFVGWWHEMERYHSDEFEGECISSNYAQSGDTLQVVDTNVVDNNGNVQTSTVTISADGVIRKLDSNGVILEEILVLATDYNNFALLYSCTNEDSEYRRVWSAVHSKTRVIDAAAEQAMQTIIDANTVLHDHLYVPVNQSPEVCFHYPEKTDGSVILPGQCDLTITGAPSFNITSFEGNWYHISQYDPVQDRSCAGTRFIPNSETGGVDIVDYYVLNEELETKEATGMVSGDGIMTVTWADPETEETKATQILILATDYTNYAVAYRCTNVGDLRRQVSVWQLSRERVMPVAGTQAIAGLIQQREELYAEYFTVIPQDSECPEPSSAFLFKSSIIVILVCALLQLAFN